MKLLFLSTLALVAPVHACQREFTSTRHPRHAKRQTANATFPPVLDSNEQILVNSFDNTTISTWSYYYGRCFPRVKTPQADSRVQREWRGRATVIPLYSFELMRYPVTPTTWQGQMKP